MQRGKLLFWSFAYGTTTKQREAVSANCKKRERVLKNRPPSLIDFHAQHDIIELKDGKICVELNFAAI